MKKILTIISFCAVSNSFASQTALNEINIVEKRIIKLLLYLVFRGLI